MICGRVLRSRQVLGEHQVKLLLDQNLSYKIATLLKTEYPGSVAARGGIVTRNGRGSLAICERILKESSLLVLSK